MDGCFDALDLLVIGAERDYGTLIVSNLNRVRHIVIDSIAIAIGLLILMCFIAYFVLQYRGSHPVWIKCPSLVNSYLPSDPTAPITVTKLELTAEYTVPLNISDEDSYVLAVSPDLQMLAYAYPNQVTVSNIESGSKSFQVSVPEETLSSAAWSSTSRYLAVGLSGYQRPYELGQIKTFRWGNRVAVWDVVSGEEILSREVDRGDYDNFIWVGSLHFSPDDSLLIAESGTGYYVWDRATGDELCHFYYKSPFWDSHTESLNLSLGWRTDEPPLIAGQVTGRGIPTNKTIIWDTQPRRTVREIDTGEDLFWSAFWSGYSHYIALRSSGIAYGVSPDQITVWDVESGERLLTLGAEYEFIDWAPDEQKILVLRDSSIEIWDIPSETKLAAIDLSAGSLLRGYWSNSGDTIVLLFDSGSVQYWSVH